MLKNYLEYKREQVLLREDTKSDVLLMSGSSRIDRASDETLAKCWSNGTVREMLPLFEKDWNRELTELREFSMDQSGMGHTDISKRPSPRKQQIYEPHWRCVATNDVDALAASNIFEREYLIAIVMAFASVLAADIAANLDPLSRTGLNEDALASSLWNHREGGHRWLPLWALSEDGRTASRKKQTTASPFQPEVVLRGYLKFCALLQAVEGLAFEDDPNNESAHQVNTNPHRSGCSVLFPGSFSFSFRGKKRISSATRLRENIARAVRDKTAEMWRELLADASQGSWAHMLAERNELAPQTQENTRRLYTFLAQHAKAGTQPPVEGPLMVRSGNAEGQEHTPRATTMMTPLEYDGVMIETPFLPSLLQQRLGLPPVTCAPLHPDTPSSSIAEEASTLELPASSRLEEEEKEIGREILGYLPYRFESSEEEENREALRTDSDDGRRLQLYSCLGTNKRRRLQPPAAQLLCRLAQRVFTAYPDRSLLPAQFQNISTNSPDWLVTFSFMSKLVALLNNLEAALRDIEEKERVDRAESGFTQTSSSIEIQISWVDDVTDYFDRRLFTAILYHYVKTSPSASAMGAQNAHAGGPAPGLKSRILKIVIQPVSFARADQEPKIKELEPIIVDLQKQMEI
ncbi:unnamed protein product [Amoebophrya sp. A25]|nr:unnamed protein product [Amoebophrya sp. A25]|eukprot:GSA25T00012571001.1